MNVQELLRRLLFSGAITWLFLVVLLISWPSSLIAQNIPIGNVNSPSYSKSPSTYGPVVTNEGLWGIAETLRSDDSHSIAQVALALFKLNPAAFSQANMNGLLEGSVLKVPSMHEITRVSSQDAIALVKNHWLQWQTDRNKPVEQHENQQTAVVTLAPTAVKVSPTVSNDHEHSNISLTRMPENSETSIQISQNTLVSSTPPAPELSSTPPAPELSSSVLDKLKQFNVSDYLRQIEWYSFEQVLQGYKEIAGFDVKTLDIIASGNWLLSSLLQSPIVMVLFGLVIFILLVIFFKRQEQDIGPLDPQLHTSTRIEADSAKESLNRKNVLPESSSIDECLIGNRDYSDSSNQSASIKVEDELSFREDDSHWQSSPIIDELAKLSDDRAVMSDIMPESKPLDGLEKDKSGKLSPGKRPGRGKNLLEAAFDKDMFANGVGFIQDDARKNPTQPIDVDRQTSELGHEISQQLGQELGQELRHSDNLLDSVDEIRFVNDHTRSSKVEAFWKMTQSESMTDELLSNEFSNFKDSDKLEVFIAEFEDIMASLASQTPAIEKAPDVLENIVQFKLSVHFIKVLSDMMQASHLKQFSDTVIEFLEDIIDGKTKMSEDVILRLIMVVSSYKQYIHFIKSSHSIKL